MVRDEIKEKYNNQCAICLRRACHVHHVLPRSRGGRNVITNGLLLCNNCHKEVHADNELLKYWINEFKKKYGSLFFMDREDIEYKQLTQELKKEDKQLKEWEKYNGKFDN
jgi:predicted restriction endonuclease